MLYVKHEEHMTNYVIIQNCLYFSVSLRISYNTDLPSQIYNLTILTHRTIFKPKDQINIYSHEM